MSDYHIKRTITEKDIPPTRRHVKSKWEGILTSMNSLNVEEGIEVAVPYSSVIGQLKRLAKNRMPRKHFDIAGRNHKGETTLYIIRKQ